MHLVGGNFRLDALQAAVLRVKLRHLESWTEARRARAASYRDLFAAAGIVHERSDVGVAANEAIVLPHEVPAARHVYNQFVVRTARRDALRTCLAEQGIESAVYYPLPLHQQGGFASDGDQPGAFPRAERMASEALALPIYPELSLSSQERLVAEVLRFLKSDS